MALELYATGNSDAMYLAGLMADTTKITKEQLEDWINNAYWSYLSEYAMPWVAAETNYGFELGLKWINSEKETAASVSWGTANEDENLDINAYIKLLETVKDEIHTSKNRVRYTMNGFVIAVGSYIESLTEKSLQIAEQIRKVNVDVGGLPVRSHSPIAT